MTKDSQINMKLIIVLHEAPKPHSHCENRLLCQNITGPELPLHVEGGREIDKREELEKKAKEVVGRLEEWKSVWKLWTEDVSSRERGAQGPKPHLMALRDLQVAVNNLIVEPHTPTDHIEKWIPRAEEALKQLQDLINADLRKAHFYEAEKLLEKFDSEEWSKRIAHAKKDKMFQGLAELVHDAEFDLRTQIIEGRKEQSLRDSKKVSELRDRMHAFLKADPPLPPGISEIRETTAPLRLTMHNLALWYDTKSEHFQLLVEVDGVPMAYPPAAQDRRAPFFAKWRLSEHGMPSHTFPLQRQPSTVRVSVLGRDGTKYGPQEIRLDVGSKPSETELSASDGGSAYVTLSLIKTGQ